MSDMINKIAYLQETKNLMKTKLGTTSDVLRDYVPLMKLDDGLAPTAWSQPYYEEIFNRYQRPSDWLTMPTLVDGDERCVILNPIGNCDSNFAALTCTGD